MAAVTTPGQTTVRRVQVRSNFERYAFLFMRLTGVLLLFLAVGHMMIQHVLNDVHLLEDYIHNRQRVRVINWVLAVVMVITILWSAVAIFTFPVD
jgi:succinate dehydrogenase hydrophobic anchor subunit